MQPTSYKDLVRPGWSRRCLFCSEEMKYTVLKVASPPEPFFYCDGSIDVLRRASDREPVDSLFAERERANESVTDTELEEIWRRCLARAPDCPRGGAFRFWANVRCPHCDTEFPYNQGVKDVHRRLYEPNVIVVDGAVVLGDTAEQSWRARVKL